MNDHRLDDDTIANMWTVAKAMEIAEEDECQLEEVELLEDLSKEEIAIAVELLDKYWMRSTDRSTHEEQQELYPHIPKNAVASAVVPAGFIDSKYGTFSAIRIVYLLEKKSTTNPPPNTFNL